MLYNQCLIHDLFVLIFFQSRLFIPEYRKYQDYRIFFIESVVMALVIEMVMALSKDFSHPAKLVRPLKIIFIVSLKRRKPRRVFYKLTQYT